MRTQRSREGYFLIDHRASPGITLEDAKRLGLTGPIVGEGQVLEAPTFTCAHCQGIVIMNPDRKRERAHCRKCNARVCDLCGAAGECTPYQAKIEQRMKLPTNGV